MNEHNDVELVLHRQELAATVEALYESLLRRVRWTVQRNERQIPGGWASNDFQTAQSCIDQTAGALARALMLVGEQENVQDTFLSIFTPTAEVWELVNEVTLASSWAEAPVHPDHGSHCQVCGVLAGV